MVEVVEGEKEEREESVVEVEKKSTKTKTKKKRERKRDGKKGVDVESDDDDVVDVVRRYDTASVPGPCRDFVRNACVNANGLDKRDRCIVLASLSGSLPSSCFVHADWWFAEREREKEEGGGRGGAVVVVAFMLSCSHHGGSTSLMFLYVDPPYRRNGVGGRLVSLLAHEATTKNASDPRFWLDCNPKVVGFFRKQGCVHLQRYRGFERMQWMPGINSEAWERFYSLPDVKERMRDEGWRAALARVLVEMRDYACRSEKHRSDLVEMLRVAKEAAKEEGWTGDGGRGGRRDDDTEALHEGARRARQAEQRERMLRAEAIRAAGGENEKEKEKGEEKGGGGEKEEDDGGGGGGGRADHHSAPDPAATRKTKTKKKRRSGSGRRRLSSPSSDAKRAEKVEMARQHEEDLRLRESARVAEIERRLSLVRLGDEIGRGK